MSNAVLPTPAVTPCAAVCANYKILPNARRYKSIIVAPAKMSAAPETGSINMTKNVNNQTNRTNKLIMNSLSTNNDKKSEHSGDSSSVIKVKSVIPRRRQDLLKWYGWGYKDSMFQLNGDYAMFTGDRYSICGQPLPYLQQWAYENFKLDLTKPPNIPDLPTSFPESRLPENIRQELESIALVSVEGMDRLIRAHGQTLRDITNLRGNKFERIPDAVIWPESHEQVEKIVQCASRHNFVLIPFGGGTSVSGAVTCPAKEMRPIVALDTSEMNAILWLDKEQLLARVQAGIVGQDLEREMRARGFTVGHEPDSYEFSTLGGWVATRASGMKKNTYGNIEDIIVQTKVVTTQGVIEKGCRVPRISCGPEWEHVVMGSEGCLGVVTEVTLKIRPQPTLTRYGSLVFPRWAAAVRFQRAVARARLRPASIRLMDNHQFRFGQALKTESSWGGVFLDGLKKLYITKIKGFDPEKLCVVTLLMEGSSEEVADIEKKLKRTATQFGGVPAGADNGRRGYTLTFVIAYLRDVAIEYGVVAESFETSVPWDRTLALCRNVKQRIRDECASRGIEHFLISCRLTQTYDAGCCIYFYFGFRACGRDPVAAYEEIEEAARDEIIACGGSISHHHGVGKLRKKWYSQTVSEPGRQLLLAAKGTLDPGNVFALGNMAFGEGPDLRSKL
ncbi:alkyldihydroxyacetonephosphate synthase [Plodia interpunctella]|uniref:alkyldihydroxyacetonephosphate synthase n=1 Tax=Plodia interpunctella TaxID=58824 RepID=UPI00236790EF|nr:alkyldihydroxyacetonephosphate synthase [Plodia interpunctella]